MTDVFERHRPLLFGIAYRMLGTISDAEDVVQDAWLRWNAVRDEVDNPRGYLARTVTNLSLNRLRSAAAQRETYVGPWLPEPLVRADPTDDPAEGVDRAESVSLALLVVLETLSPLERAVFVLKEAFGYSYREIAGILDRSETAVRQVGHRARAHVEARRPRFDVPAATRRKVTEQFLAVCASGDVQRIVELLAPDVTAWTDGGGKVRAALRPLHGADKVARWIVGVLQRTDEPMAALPVDVNGLPGVVVTFGDSIDSVVCLDVVDGKVTEIWGIRNPDKLRHLRI